jgi:leader peptidase (prepilin peptidase)/N-methyltransferase
METLFGFLTGATLGSFLGCCYWRLYRKESLWGRSYCPHCKKEIPFYQNIPILSWLQLRGKSACCLKPLSKHYLLFEFFSAVLGAIIGFILGLVGLMVFAFVVITIPVIISVLQKTRQT